jgi:hypothetical protein
MNFVLDIYVYTNKDLLDTFRDLIDTVYIEKDFCYINAGNL